MQLKTKKTSRKFYNKWLYKVSLIVQGSGIFRIQSIEDIIQLCLDENPDSREYSVYHKAWKNREQLLELATFLQSHDCKNWTKRIESSIMDFYTNDPNFYTELSEKFEDVMTHRFEPDASSLEFLDQPQTIVASKLPHNKYHYKVYLLPHKMAGDKENKARYVDWLKTQNPRITCTPAVQSWFIKTDWNWDRRYILVEDEQSLLMLKLRNSEVVGRVYNYVISDK